MPPLAADTRGQAGGRACRTHRWAPSPRAEARDPTVDAPAHPVGRSVVRARRRAGDRRAARSSEHAARAASARRRARGAPRGARAAKTAGTRGGACSSRSPAHGKAAAPAARQSRWARRVVAEDGEERARSAGRVMKAWHASGAPAGFRPQGDGPLARRHTMAHGLPRPGAHVPRARA